jgi:DNA-binding transcriptional regulator YdaS (Cro superfamily)
MAMPVATALKVKALSKDLGSQRKLAELLDVSPAQVTRWLKGQGIDAVNADRVDLLEVVMSQLLRLYTPDVAAMWLVGFNPHLRDSRPIDVLRRGDVRDLLDAISQERAGSYA